MEIPHFLLPNRIPIPSQFHSIYHEGPFPKCEVCQCNLLEDDVRYFIEKTFVGTEVVYEYAICHECRDEIREDLSEESMLRIQSHFEERLDWDERVKDLTSGERNDIETWISKCILTKRQRKDCRIYSIGGELQGTSLLLTDTPFMLCDEAIGELAELLSKQTRDRLDDFRDQIVGMPPEFERNPESPDLVLL